MNRQIFLFAFFQEPTAHNITIERKNLKTMNEVTCQLFFQLLTTDVSHGLVVRGSPCMARGPKFNPSSSLMFICLLRQKVVE